MIAGRRPAVLHIVKMYIGENSLPDVLFQDCGTGLLRQSGPQSAQARELVQLLADVLNAFGDQFACQLALRFRGEDFLGGSDGGLCGGTTHVGGGLRFGLGDLGFGHLGAAGDKIFNLCLGLEGKPFGFGLGTGNDVLRFAFGGLPFALIFGQQLGGLVPQATCFVEFCLDTRRAVVQRLSKRAVHAEITE